MQVDITNVVEIAPVYADSVNLIEMLQKAWMDKNFPDRPFYSHIDIYNPNGNSNYVMQCRKATFPFEVGKYDEYTIELTAQQTAEYKIIRKMHNIFYE